MRAYYRSANTGDLGWLEKVDGKEMIRLERPGITEHMPFKNGDGWIPENERRPMTLYGATQIAFEADRQLCRTLHIHTLAKREWIGLKDEQRIEWEAIGPKKPAIRAELYKAIRDVLRPYSK